MPADSYRKPGYIVQLDSDTGAGLYLGSTDLGKALAAGKAKLVKGDQEKIAGVLDLFDKFVPTSNYTIPPLKD